MQPYSVEIFNRSFEYVSHTTIPPETFEYGEDYIDPENNKIDVPRGTVCNIDNYIRIFNGERSYYGIISATEEGAIDTGTDGITYKPFITSFDCDIMLDLDLIGTGSIEQYIAARISELFVNNPDAEQNIHGLTVSTGSETTGWTLDIAPSEEGGHNNVVNMFDHVILAAFKQYGIILTTAYDIKRKQVLVNIARSNIRKVTIEADLANILSRRIMLRKAKKIVNKVIVYNQKDYNQSRVWYLHTDGTFSEENRDRVTPVAFSVESVSADDTASFNEEAEKKAEASFAGNQYENLIELECLNDDMIVDPLGLRIGQTVEVISGQQVIESILTGRRIGETTMLTFGTIRLELTKFLKGRG